MKKNFCLLFALAAISLASADVFAYSANTGADPKNGTADLESKQVVKAQSAGESSSISKGHVLFYSSAADGYTVSRIGGSFSATDQNRLACIAQDAIATGDYNYHDCVVKGYVDYLKYDATLPITAFNMLCVNNEGVAVACAASYGATRSTGILGLETKASGTGTMKAIIQLK